MRVFKEDEWIEIVSQDVARREKLDWPAYGQVISDRAPFVLDAILVSCEDGKVHDFGQREIAAIAEGQIPESNRERIAAAWTRPLAPAHVATVKCRKCNMEWPVRPDLATADGWISSCRGPNCAVKADKLGRKRRPRNRESLTLDHPEYRIDKYRTGPSPFHSHKASSVDVDEMKEEITRRIRAGEKLFQVVDDGPLPDCVVDARRRRAAVKLAERTAWDTFVTKGSLSPEEKFLLGEWRNSESYAKISEKLRALGIKCSERSVPAAIERALKRAVPRLRWRPGDIDEIMTLVGVKRKFRSGSDSESDSVRHEGAETDQVSSFDEKREPEFDVPGTETEERDKKADSLVAEIQKDPPPQLCEVEEFKQHPEPCLTDDADSDDLDYVYGLDRESKPRREDY